MASSKPVYRKKAGAQRLCFIIISYAGFLAAGWFAGDAAGGMARANNWQGSRLPAVLALLTALFGVYCIQLWCHELGHLLFGLLDGYRFSSIRFGSLMLVRSEGRLQWKRHRVAGTGGQVLMLPPPAKADPADFPVLWYNLGGLLVNLGLSALGLVLWLLLPAYSLMSVLCGMLCLTGIIVLVTNGLPLSMLGTDGANALLLYRSAPARLALRQSLEINAALADGAGMQIVEETLAGCDPRAAKLDNPLVTALAVMQFGCLTNKQHFAKARDLGLYILENAAALNATHELVILCELVYLHIMLDDPAAADAIMAEHAVRMKPLKGQISYHRAMYTYQRFCKHDEAAAESHRSTFLQLLPKHPYPADAADERQLLALAEARCGQRPEVSGKI